MEKAWLSRARGFKNKDWIRCCMMEILLGLWAFSLIVCLCLAALNLYLLKRKYQKSSYLCLNSNLKEIGYFWSISKGQMTSLSESDPQLDYDYSFKQGCYLMILGLFSLPGLIILTLALVGLHFLSEDRVEQRFFSSRLATDQKLSSNEISKLVAELNAYT